MLKQNTRTFYFILALIAVCFIAGNLRDSVVEASQSESKFVTLIMGNTKKSVSTKSSTVGDLLKELEIELDYNDKISHSLKT